MKKLYTPLTDLPTLQVVSVEDAQWPTESLDQLKHNVEGYCNADELYSSVANESYRLVDNKNKALYNAYTALLADKLGVGMPVLQKLATESLEGAEGISANHGIALEGFLGNLWEKIKGFFKSIYKNIQAFFTKHFTRLGKVKKSLENLKSVLGKTEKAMVPPEDLNYTGSLLKRYAGYTTVNSSTATQSLTSVSTLVASVKKINDAAKEMADKNLVDKNFFDKIKSLTEKSATSSARKEDVDEDLAASGKPGFGSGKQAKQDYKEKSQTSKKLGDIAAAADKEATGMDDKVESAAGVDEGSDEGNLEAAKTQMAAFMKVVVDSLKSGVNDKLISGKVISKVDVTDKLELEVEMSLDAQDAEGVTLSGKGGLIPLVNSAIELIVTTEKQVKTYGEVNDTIMKNLDTVDKLIADIDRIDPAKYGKYKSMVNTQVRERLMLMQRFFSAYNKVGKNVMELSMDSCEGVVDYALLSLKYFK